MRPPGKRPGYRHAAVPEILSQPFRAGRHSRHARMVHCGISADDLHTVRGKLRRVRACAARRSIHKQRHQKRHVQPYADAGILVLQPEQRRLSACQDHERLLQDRLAGFLVAHGYYLALHLSDRIHSGHVLHQREAGPVRRFDSAGSRDTVLHLPEEAHRGQPRGQGDQLHHHGKLQ